MEASSYFQNVVVLHDIAFSQIFRTLIHLILRDIRSSKCFSFLVDAQLIVHYTHTHTHLRASGGLNILAELEPLDRTSSSDSFNLRRRSRVSGRLLSLTSLGVVLFFTSYGVLLHSSLAVIFSVCLIFSF